MALAGFRAQAVVRIGPATPLRLNVAAALAFPDGSMTASGHGYDAEAWLVAAEASIPKLAGGSAP
jgi:hypothetical protein